MQAKEELQIQNFEVNLLPFDGEVYFVDPSSFPFDSNILLDTFKNRIAWQNDIVKIYGKTIECKRQTAWYGDSEIAYSYSGIKKLALPWTKELAELKQYFQNTHGFELNSCLLNLYKNGEESMSWHSDNEKELGADPLIISLSLGAERVFHFRHKQTNTKYKVKLPHGSILVMKGSTQHYWQHCIPKELKVKDLRINLTFRKIVMV